MPEADPSRILPFETPTKFHRWLKTHHATERELWVRMYKKGSGQKSINWDEAVIEALCWGWIDGVRKGCDEHSFLQRFTPRKKGSNWSKRNREHVERLLAAGRMEDPGLAHVHAAQADGRWENAYAPASEMEIPADFLAAVARKPKARKFLATLNKANLYAIGYRLTTAKRPETRQKRFDQILAMLENGEKFH